MQNGENGESGKPGFSEKFKKWVEEYARHYSDPKFWKKIEKFFKKIGKKVLKPALILFYAAQDANMHPRARAAQATMIGALGYFIYPLDAILDITPIAGYADDWLVLTAATAVVAAHIKEEHREKAEESLNRWLGEDS